MGRALRDCGSLHPHMRRLSSLLQTYTEEERIIITQLPFPTTLVDFWSLVWDYTCTSVVVLNQLQELDKVSSQAQVSPLLVPCGVEQCDFCLCLCVELTRRALLVPGPTASLWGSIRENPEGSPSTTAPQQWAVLGLTAREHPSGFVYPYPGVLSDGVLFSGCSSGLVPSRCLAEPCVHGLWVRGWCEPTHVRC